MNKYLDEFLSKTAWWYYYQIWIIQAKNMWEIWLEKTIKRWKNYKWTDEQFAVKNLPHEWSEIWFKIKKI